MKNQLKGDKPVTQTKNTVQRAIRIPLWLVELVEEEKNQSAAFIEMMKIGAAHKYGVQK